MGDENRAVSNHVLSQVARAFNRASRLIGESDSAAASRRHRRRDDAAARGERGLGSIARERLQDRLRSVALLDVPGDYFPVGDFEARRTAGEAGRGIRDEVRERHVSFLSRRLGETESLLRSIVSENDKTRRTVAAAVKDLERATGVTDEGNRAYRDLDARLVKLVRNVSGLEAAGSDMRADAERYHAALAGRLDDLAAGLSRLEQSNADLERNHRRLDDRCVELRQSQSDAARDLRALTAGLGAVRSGLRRQFQHLGERVGSVSTELRLNERKRGRAQGRLERGLQSSFSRLGRSLASISEEIASIDRSITRENVLLAQAVTLAENENTALRDRFEALTARGVKAEKELQSIRQTAARIGDNLSDFLDALFEADQLSEQQLADLQHSLRPGPES